LDIKEEFKLIFNQLVEWYLELPVMRKNLKLTGHKTPSMFQRYNTVDLTDVKEAYQKLELLLEQG
jgi:hypothetical protein